MCRAPAPSTAIFIEGLPAQRRCRWIGANRLMLSTDYPHWHFDNPARAFKVDLSKEDRAAILRENAVALFRLNMTSVTVPSVDWAKPHQADEGY